MDSLTLFSAPLQAAQIRGELQRCNTITQKYGLYLSAADMNLLAQRRQETLRAAGRVEFGGGILQSLTLAFCDSPYLQQRDYAAALDALQSIFYQQKTACREQLTDDELLAALRLVYDEVSRGDLDFLASLDPETLCAIGRTGSLRGTPLEEEALWEDADE